MKRALVLCVVLIGCATPQERCIQRETRDMRVIDRLIAESEGNLKRGYALEEVTIYRHEWVLCDGRHRPEPPKEGQPAPSPRPPKLCFEAVPDTVTRPKAIDLRAEADKLASMRAKRAALARAAQPAIAQCKAQYPE